MTPTVTVFQISASFDLVNVCQTWEDLQECLGNQRSYIFQHNITRFTSIMSTGTGTCMAACDGAFI